MDAFFNDMFGRTDKLFASMSFPLSLPNANGKDIDFRISSDELPTRFKEMDWSVEHRFNSVTFTSKQPSMNLYVTWDYKKATQWNITVSAVKDVQENNYTSSSKQTYTFSFDTAKPDKKIYEKYIQPFLDKVEWKPFMEPLHKCMDAASNCCSNDCKCSNENKEVQVKLGNEQLRTFASAEEAAEFLKNNA